MIYILSISIITSILGVLYFIKYKTLKTKVSNIIKQIEKPLRSGYYSGDYTQTKNSTGEEIDYTATSFVKEIDRFTNGDSKITLEKIEIYCENSALTVESAETHIRNNFMSIRKTSDVIWLESEQSIKDMRKEKLEQLNKLFKK